MGLQQQPTRFCFCRCEKRRTLRGTTGRNPKRNHKNIFHQQTINTSLLAHNYAASCAALPLQIGSARFAGARGSVMRGGMQWHEQNWKSVRLGLSVYSVKKKSAGDGRFQMRQLCQQILELR
jgi:hypothetical protein